MLLDELRGGERKLRAWMRCETGSVDAHLLDLRNAFDLADGKGWMSGLAKSSGKWL